MTPCVRIQFLENLYVVGDTNVQAPLIHMGKYSTKLVQRKHSRKKLWRQPLVPHSATAQQSAYTSLVTSTDLQVTSAGLTPAEALKEGNTADLLHASTVAIVGGVDIGRLWHAVPSFPTMSEIYGNLLNAWPVIVAPMVLTFSRSTRFDGLR
jgi:hypothetical protein